jgi:hypothetical protein
VQLPTVLGQGGKLQDFETGVQLSLGLGSLPPPPPMGISFQVVTTPLLSICKEPSGRIVAVQLSPQEAVPLLSCAF